MPVFPVIYITLGAILATFAWFLHESGLLRRRDGSELLVADSVAPIRDSESRTIGRLRPRPGIHPGIRRLEAKPLCPAGTAAGARGRWVSGLPSGEYATAGRDQAPHSVTTSSSASSTASSRSRARARMEVA